MSNATPIKLFPVDSYDLKSMSFKFGNDIFIIFEMPGSSYQRPVGKNNISLLFRPSVIRGPWKDSHSSDFFFNFKKFTKSCPSNFSKGKLLTNIFTTLCFLDCIQNHLSYTAKRERVGAEANFEDEFYQKESPEISF